MKSIEQNQSVGYTEVVYPSMYYGYERQLTDNRRVRPQSHSGVNNIYLNGVRVASLSSSGKIQYYLTDQVDSVKVVVDEKGKTINRFEYLPYGETWVKEGGNLNNPKFNSQELDKETNFYFYNARHYDQEIARFVTADNVIDGEYSAKGWNRYMYVGGNSVVYMDPTGHEAITDFVDKTINKVKNTYNNYKNLKLHDKQAVKNDPVGSYFAESSKKYYEKETANRIKNKLYKATTNHNGQADAFIHSLWNVSMSKKIGVRRAYVFSTIHEMSNYKNGKFVYGNTIENQMDINNNKVGLQVAKNNIDKSIIEIAKRLEEKIKKGELSIIVSKKDHINNVNKKYRAIMGHVLIIRK